MVVIEVNLPTGYLVDEDSLPSHKDFDDLKQVDIGNGVTKVLIYFDKVGYEIIFPNVNHIQLFHLIVLQLCLVYNEFTLYQFFIIEIP